MPAPLLSMQRITKTYPGVVALEDVSFEVERGDVHCLLGENGAGKSTLVKILSGAIACDHGEIALDGIPVVIASPADAQRLGISVVYQDFKLVQELSVAENILLGHEPLTTRGRFIDFAELHTRAQTLIQQLGEEIETRALVRDLSTAQRQIVEIAKALSRRVRVLVLDEPTASLTERETDNLFRIIRRLKGEGVSVIYISHRLEEVFAIGDRLTVLRDGKLVVTCAVAEATKPQLIRWMVGRDLEHEYPAVELTRGEELLRVEHLSSPKLRDVSLTLRKGEILGIAGLVGAGRTELARAIFGADRITNGKIFLKGVPIAPRSPQEAIALGIGLLTEDRNQQGLFLQMNVRENISISNLSRIATASFIRREEEREAGSRFIRQIRIKTPSSEVAVDTLSGGNRQKVVLARWLFTQSKVLIFDEPTVGIDVGAKLEIYQLINQLAADGVGVIMISSDMSELLGMCDRIAVMCQGRLKGILESEAATQETIMAMATP